jgi:exopolyphosphatase/guanosine-5'-triphosphate,3'-diphosphate pyrophosphatase
VNRVAALDCGTNSLRLLIADIDEDGTLTDVTRQMRIVRLGQDVDRTGRLAPEALERARAALVEYAEEIGAANVAATRLVATSAVRDAANRADFDRLVRSTIGVTPEVVSGDEEARLSFAGAVSVPAVAEHEDVIVTDIGGGSSELIRGRTRPPAVTGAFSMDVGSVRLTERHFHDDPPTLDQVAAAIVDIEAALDVAATTVDLRPGAMLIGVAGTVTSLAAMVLGLPAYDSARIHGLRVARDRMDAVVDRLLRQAHAERSAIPSLHPGRVDVIAAGAVVLRTIMRRLDAAEIVVSEHDILDGIAASIVA